MISLDIEREIKLRPKIPIPANPMNYPPDLPIDDDFDLYGQESNASFVENADGMSKVLVKYQRAYGDNQSDVWELNSWESII